jgi:hypothetical protein
MIEARYIGRKKRKLAQAAVAVYFVLFVLVMLPCHALVCESLGATSQHSLFDSSGGSVRGNHHPELCQICRTHGQLDAQIIWPTVSNLDGNCTGFEGVALLSVGYVLVHTPSRRAPPSRS